MSELDWGSQSTQMDLALGRLAKAQNVATSYTDFSGKHCRVSHDTLVAVLTSLGHDVESIESIEREIDALELARLTEILPPSLVMRAGADTQINAQVPQGQSVTVHVELEDGEQWALATVGTSQNASRLEGPVIDIETYVLPGDLPLGWHTVVAKTSAGEEGRCTLAVTPQAQQLPELGGKRGWGMMAQLYSVRSQRSWGVGDFADMREIASIFGDKGADFLLVNPLHAAEVVVPMSDSPYLPITRRFVNPIYIRPEDIPEAAYLTGPQRSLVEWAAQDIRPVNTTNEPIDRDASWHAKKSALEVIYAAPRTYARQLAMDNFRREMGQDLEDYALWCALTESYEGKVWPAELSDPNTPFVANRRRELTERIDFYVWLQWVCDEQLRQAQRSALDAGMKLGIMQDLAVGVHPNGSDAWSRPGAFAAGVGVGAPPDMFNQQGQNWAQPPWRPDYLRASGYEPLREMARMVLRHAGALRVDHILGLFRLWWIPEGKSPAEGTYVTYDHEAMVGVVLLEAHRAGALIIGEDLGTFEPWVREYLASRGILGTSVMWFEQRHGGVPRAAEDYPVTSLATVNTHDLPPCAGYLAEEHVDLRERLGLLTVPVQIVRRDARREREAYLRLMRERGYLGEDPTEREIVESLHRFVISTPSVLVGVSLTDAVGERRAQNQPGTHREYPNWKLPLADGSEHTVTVEELPGHARLKSLIKAIDEQIEASKK